MKSRNIILLLAVLLVFSSCSKKEKVSSPVRIGFSAVSETFLFERWDKDMKIFMSEAHQLGAEVVTAQSAGNAQGQIPQIQYLLKQDIDVLVVIPQDKEMLGGVIAKARNRGIPVLSYDRPVMNVPIDGYVSFDNEEVGKLLAKALVSAVPSGRYLLINGSIRDNNSYQVNKGVHEILDPFISKGQITVVDELWLDKWSFDEASRKASEVFAKTDDIQAVCCANDMIAEAVIRNLAEHRLAGKVAVVGQDADLIACQRIVEGTQLMTVYKPIPILAERAAKLAVALAEKQKPPPECYFDNNSGSRIPFYVETPIAVYKEQMDATIIKDGFHSREDVYRK